MNFYNFFISHVVSPSDEQRCATPCKAFYSNHTLCPQLSHLFEEKSHLDGLGHLSILQEHDPQVSIARTLHHPWLLSQVTIVSAKLVCRHHSAAQARSHQSRKPCAIWAFQAAHRPYRWVTVRIYHTGLPVYSTLLVRYNTHMCRRYIDKATISCPPSASRFPSDCLHTYFVDTCK